MWQLRRVHAKRHDLLKCPNCGVHLDEPNETEEKRPKFRAKSKFELAIESVMRKLHGQPHFADELFTGALREASLFDDLLRKVGGDRSAVERLIEYERQLKPIVSNQLYHFKQVDLLIGYKRNGGAN